MLGMWSAYFALTARTYTYSSIRVLISHGRRQLWGTGARATSTSNYLILLVISEPHKLLTICGLKGKVDHTPSGALLGCSSPFLWP